MNKEIRDQLFLLDPEVIFLNHGSFGATPRPVFHSYQKRQLELERQPVDYFALNSPVFLRNARKALGDFLHSSENDLAYVTNATTGMNIVARSLHLGTDDEVLTSDHEYGAVDRTWKYLSQRYGFQVRFAELPTPLTSSAEIIDSFRAAITKKTRVISFSHITSPTAVIFPVKEICALARSAGILSLVDGAHAPGQIDLDLTDIGADFYTGNLHKWLCAPKGSAFLYAKPEAQKLIEPLIVSWGWQSENPGPSQFLDYLENLGTRDMSAFLAVQDAIEFHKKYIPYEARAKCHDLAQQTQAKITSLTGIPPLHTDLPTWFGMMAASRLPGGTDLTKLKNELHDHYRIEIPVFKWKNMNIIRYSFQIYNSQEDSDMLVSVLRELLS